MLIKIVCKENDQPNRNIIIIYGDLRQLEKEIRDVYKGWKEDSKKK
ncbi:MAG: hypothetical protein ACTSPU_07220 [Promethearchaeota archaeon]